MPRDGVTSPLLEQPDEPVQPLEDAEDGPDTPDHHPVGEGVLAESEVAIPDEDRDGGVPERNGSRQGQQEIPIWIELPADYTCAADCWWKVRYNYSDESTDTTTWSAYIEGNPVRLIE